MIRNFQEWWKSLPLDVREKNLQNEKEVPQLKHINYIWVSNLMNNSSELLNPTVEELVEWVKTGQVDAKIK